MMYLLTPEAHVQIVEALKMYCTTQQFVAFETLKAIQPVSPVAYRFMENRGNGNTEFNYYGLDEVGLAYRDNCLEIVDLYTPTKNAVMREK